MTMSFRSAVAQPLQALRMMRRAAQPGAASPGPATHEAPNAPRAVPKGAPAPLRPRRGLAALVAAAALALVLHAVPQTAWAAVDVNRATQAELETVRGVGPALSGRILAARQSKPFADWNDFVDRVVGVGPKSAVRLSEAGMTVAGAAYAGAPAAGSSGKHAKASRATPKGASAEPAGANRGSGAATAAAAH